jgi:hypothetical protein
MNIKFKMKAIGICLLLSASQLQAAATVKFDCTDAMLDVTNYYHARMDLHSYPNPHHHVENFNCFGNNLGVTTVQVPAGNYGLWGHAGHDTHCPHSWVNIQDGNTYYIRFDLTTNQLGYLTSCTVSAQ